jgi:DNA invertase Pin-like site-specific DNA recombinase
MVRQSEKRPAPGTTRGSPHVRSGPSDRPNLDDSAVEAVGYVSSTDAGDRVKLTLRKQIAIMDAVCEQRGWRLVEVARDIGGPNGQIDRTGLAYALERLEESKRACLIVAELRQLGGSAAELGRVLRLLRDRGLRLVAVDVDLDTEAADGRIAANALISVGEVESASKEVASAEQSDEPQAKRRGLGRHAVRELPPLREHIVAMRSAGMTLQAIADRLNEQGVPTLRGGREWRPSSVQVAAGYRRPRQVTSRGSNDRYIRNRGTEDR